MARARYYPTAVQAWCVVRPATGEPIVVPAIAIKIRFGLNSIPVGSVSFAVGRNAANPTEVSNAHTLLDHLVRGTRIEVWCKLGGIAGLYRGKEAPWPVDAFRVFDGKITVVSPEVGNGLRVSVGIIHWLGDLDKTCWLSSMIDPGGAFAIHNAAGYPMDSGGKPSGKPNRAIWWLDLSGKSPTASFEDDLWIQGLKPTLTALADNKQWDQPRNALQVRTGILQNLFGSEKPNINALAALNRMDDSDHMPVSAMPLFGGVQFGDQNPSGSLAYAITSYVSALVREMWGPEGTHTLWSKLLRFMSFSKIALSPGVETATVIPWVPILSTTWTTLSPDDVWSFVVNSQVSRSHRGVLLVARGFSPWMTRAGTAAGRKGILGFYDVTQTGSGVPEALIGDDPGTLIIRYAPSWLDPKGYSRRPASAFSRSIPWVGNKGDVVRPANPPATVSTGDALAKAMFLADVFKMRSGALTTRLRFDIAPGSTIKFQDMNPEYDVPGFTGEGMTVNVTAVEINISAVPARCGTTLEINHARMDHESGMAIAEHPLFGTAWTGGPLIKLAGQTPTW